MAATLLSETSPVSVDRAFIGGDHSLSTALILAPPPSKGRDAREGLFAPRSAPPSPLPCTAEFRLKRWRKSACRGREHLPHLQAPPVTTAPRVKTTTTGTRPPGTRPNGATPMKKLLIPAAIAAFAQI